ETIRIGRTQPLEVERQRVVTEIVVLDTLRNDAFRTRRRRYVDQRHLPSMLQIEPTILLPDAFLDRGFAAERRTARAIQRTRAKMRVVEFAVWSLDELAMARALERGVGCILRRDEMDVGMKLVGARDVA